jgi:hypothetical protein
VPKRPKKQFSCDGKIRHEYEGQAQGARKAFIARGAPSWRVQVYRCRFCRGWHVGNTLNGGRHSRKQ